MKVTTVITMTFHCEIESRTMDDDELIEEFLCKVPVHNVDGVGWEEPVITYKSQIE